MNREIKFKAWDGKKMHHNAIVGNGQVLFIPDATGEYKWVNQGEVTPLQYTGLKDKNGKEIYEGDIISIDTYPFIDNGKQNYVGVIEWIYSQWQYVSVCVNNEKSGISNGINNGLNDDGIDEGESTDYEVIGNVYQNPELLNS